LDGKGSLSGSATLAVDGSIGGLPLTGTYTENADCTGTLQIIPSGLNPGDFAFVVVNAGKELLLIQSDPAAIASGTAQQ